MTRTTQNEIVTEMFTAAAAPTAPAARMTFREQAEGIRQLLSQGPPTPQTAAAIEARMRLFAALNEWQRACEAAGPL